MISADPLYLESLRHSHESILEITALVDGVSIGELPSTHVNLQLDASADVLRRADIQVAVDPLLTESREVLEQLSVSNGTIVIKHGIGYGGALVGGGLVTLATLRVEEVSWGLSQATRTVHAFDRAMLLQEHKLPTVRPLDDTYANLIVTLIQETLPGESVTFDAGVDTSATPAAGKSFARGDDRLRRIQELAEAISGRLVNDPDGSFRVSFFDESAAAVWTIDAGGAGVLVDASGQFSRREQYNAVGIEFTPADEAGDWAGFVYLWDNDPLSPTYYDGDFGKKNIFFSEEYDHLPTTTEAETVARRKLYEYTGETRSVSLTAIYNPLLVPEDRITVVFPDGTETHVIETLSYAFGSSGAMTVDTRLERAPGSFGVTTG